MAVELGAGYVSLSVRYAEGMRKAAEGIAHEAEKAGAKAGKAIGEKVTKELPKAINTRPMEKKVEDAQRRYEKKMTRRKPKINVDVIVQGPQNTAEERAKIEKAARQYEEKFKRRRPKVPVDVHYEIPPEKVAEAKQRHREAADANADYSKKKNKEVAADQKKQTEQTVKVQTSAWGEVFDQIRARADELGIDLDKVMSDAGRRAGRAIGDAIAQTPIGAALPDIMEWKDRSVAAIGEVTSALDNVRAGDYEGAISGVGRALDALGQNDAADTLDTVVSKGRDIKGVYDDTKGVIKDFTDALGVIGVVAPGFAAGLGKVAAAATSMAGPLAAMAAVLYTCKEYMDWLNKQPNFMPTMPNLPNLPYDITTGAARPGLIPSAPGQPAVDTLHGIPTVGGIPIPGTMPAQRGPGVPTQTPPIVVAPTPRPSIAAGPTAQAPAPTLAPVDQANLDRLRKMYPGMSRGGVARSGRVYGPGTGISDSILVRLSKGEGVVKAAAMRAGAAPMVAALNRIPGYQGGLPGASVTYSPAWVQKAGLKPLYAPGTDAVPAWATELGAKFGLRTSTYSTGGSLHQAGFAFDFNGSVDKMEAFAAFVMRNLKSNTLQLIFRNPNTGRTYGIAGGEDVSGRYYGEGGQGYPGHTDHVHWAPAKAVGAGAMAGGGGGGGRVLTGTPYRPGAVGGGARGGAGGGGGGVPIMPAPGGGWTSPNPAWAHLIQRESGGNPTITQGIVDVNTGGNEATGLFQIAKGTWAGAGGTQYAPTAGQATPHQQAMIAANIFRAQGGGPWGAGLAGRENAAELAAGLSDTGLSDFGDDLYGASDYLGDFGDEIGTKTHDLGAFDTSLTSATGAIDAAAGGGAGGGAGGEGSGIQMLGELADIAQAGVKETFLPPGFSDPQSWPVMKSIGAFMGFMGGKIGGPGGSVLSGIGAGVSGSPSGMISAIAGIRPGAYGNLEPASPGLAPDDFTAMGSAQGASLAAGFVDAAQGFIPDVQQQPQNVDNSIHVGENGTVGQDPTAVRDGIRRDQMTQTRGMAATARTTF